MRKIVLFMHVSLDGYVQGSNEWDLGWVSYDHDLVSYADEVVSSVGSTLYGRVTYEGMKGYWPTVLDNSSSSEHDINHATWLESIQKIVVSRSMEKTDWNNTLLIKDNVIEELTKLKQLPGKDLVIFGSPSLSHFLMKHNFIDEYRLTVSPIILGDGVPLFKGIKDRTKLKLIESKTFPSGVVILHYARTVEEH